jgi:predicted transcriptional regulator
MRHGTLRALRRSHWIRLQHGMNGDDAVSQRHERMNVSSWGRIVPLMWQLTYATKSADIRSGRVGAVAIGARTLDAHVVATGPEHPIDRTTRSQIQRQLQHELATFLPTLKSSFATTATASLAARFLALHTEFDVTVPNGEAVETAAKQGRTVPALHREVFHMAAALVATDLERRAESLAPATSAEADAESSSSAAERTQARLASETHWIAAEAEQAAAWIESSAVSEDGATPELELVGRLKSAVGRSRAVAAEWPSSDSSPMLGR